MEKRGSSHIEMVFAFILFIGVILFVFYFFSYRPQIDDNSLSEYALSQIENNLSTNIIEYSVVTNNSIKKSVIALNISQFNSEEGIIIMNSSGAFLKYKLNGDELNVDKEENNFFYIIVGKDIDLNESDLPLQIVNSGEFSISSVRNFSIISEKRFKTLNNSYAKDYPPLKKSLGIGDKNDFSASIKFSDADYIKMDKQIPAGYQVYAKTKRVEVIRESGQKTFANLQVNIW